jgi:Rad3-related DNA helicase
VRERLVSYGNGEGDEAYEAWIEDGRNDSVLLSVAMCEGIDLKDDLARFQILFKCPYPAQDEFIRRRMELDDGQQWYTYQAQTATIQAYGRAVRSPDDWAEFWVLDATAEYLFRDIRDLPPFFADAWKARRTIV